LIPCSEELEDSWMREVAREEGEGEEGQGGEVRKRRDRKQELSSLPGTFPKIQGGEGCWVSTTVEDVEGGVR
jgi:hypothetical protein